MKRYVDLKEISDGRLYDINDMAKLGCNGCQGCSSCCHHMSNTIVLDPLDIYRLTRRLNKSFQELVEQQVGLRVADGIILPYLCMSEQDACIFLNQEGWCSIHQDRPGLCRLFPLGRYYGEDGDFKYILQTGECYRENRTKVKISKWIDVQDYAANKKYVLSWHRFLNDVQELIARSPEGADKQIDMFILGLFFVQDYDRNADFYGQYYERLEKAVKILGIA